MSFINKAAVFFVIAVMLSVIPGPSEAASPEYTIKVGTIVSETHPDFRCMQTVFKKQVEALSKGRIKVELYPNAQLGGDREMIESVQMGTLTMAMPATSALAGFEKRFQVLDLPFLFKDKKSAYSALDGELGKKLDGMLPKHGFVNLGYFENGFRHITNNRKPVKTPADLKGLKIRTMENPMHIATFKLLGANPTPMNFGELYTALQQKTVDGQENPIAIVWDGKFYEVQKYYSLTGHFFSVVMLLANKDFMDKLPKDLHGIVVKAAKDFYMADRKMVDAEETALLNKMKEKGLKVNTLSAKEKEEFVRLTKPVYDQFKDQLGADIIDLARKYGK